MRMRVRGRAWKRVRLRSTRGRTADERELEKQKVWTRSAVAVVEDFNTLSLLLSCPRPPKKTEKEVDEKKKATATNV